jgi:hypothetical protein
LKWLWARLGKLAAMNVKREGSRYCETDRLNQTAWDTFGTRAPGWGRVQAVCDFVHQHIKFDYQQAR